jgi:hypothetical protein
LQDDQIEKGGVKKVEQQVCGIEASRVRFPHDEINQQRQKKEWTVDAHSRNLHVIAGEISQQQIRFRSANAVKIANLAKIVGKKIACYCAAESNKHAEQNQKQVNVDACRHSLEESHPSRLAFTRAF